MTYLEYKFYKHNNRNLAKKELENIIKSMYKNYFNKKDLIIEKNKNGKPFFKNIYDIYFNGTHTDDLFSVIMSDEYNVGIDAEKIRKRNFLDIADEYFYKNEYNYLKKSMKLEIDFFTIWTIKESYIKMLGKTIFDIKNSIEVDLNERIIKNSNNIFFSTFMLDDSYIITISCRIKDKNDNINLLLKDFNLNMLFSYPKLPNIYINI